MGAADHHNRGIALAASGDLDEAVDQFTRAIELDPSSAAAVANLGTALRSQGRLDEAIAVLELACHLRPDSAAVSSRLLLTRHFIGEHMNTEPDDIEPGPQVDQLTDQPLEGLVEETAEDENEPATPHQDTDQVDPRADFLASLDALDRAISTLEAQAKSLMHDLVTRLPPQRTPAQAPEPQPLPAKLRSGEPTQRQTEQRPTRYQTPAPSPTPVDETIRNFLLEGHTLNGLPPLGTCPAPPQPDHDEPQPDDDTIAPEAPGQGDPPSPGPASSPTRPPAPGRASASGDAGQPATATAAVGILPAPPAGIPARPLPPPAAGPSGPAADSSLPLPSVEGASLPTQTVVILPTAQGDATAPHASPLPGPGPSRRPAALRATPDAGSLGPRPVAQPATDRDEDLHEDTQRDGGSDLSFPVTQVAADGTAIASSEQPPRPIKQGAASPPAIAGEVSAAATELRARAPGPVEVSPTRSRPKPDDVIDHHGQVERHDLDGAHETTPDPSGHGWAVVGTAVRGKARPYRDDPPEEAPGTEPGELVDQPGTAVQKHPDARPRGDVSVGGVQVTSSVEAHPAPRAQPATAQTATPTPGPAAQRTPPPPPPTTVPMSAPDDLTTAVQGTQTALALTQQAVAKDQDVIAQLNATVRRLQANARQLNNRANEQAPTASNTGSSVA